MQNYVFLMKDITWCKEILVETLCLTEKINGLNVDSSSISRVRCCDSVDEFFYTMLEK